MKKYPSIGKAINDELEVIGFDKLDGSNIRAEWDKKSKKFTRFGTRKLLLDESHPALGRAIGIIRDKYEAKLTQKFLALGYPQVTAFFEFFGDESFAGYHEPGDPTVTAVLIDLMIYKKGIIHPRTFVDEFGPIGIPAVLHDGKITKEIIKQIENGTFPNMTFEGVVFKGRMGKKAHLPVMFKVKNKAWIAKLKEFCRGDEKLFDKLA